MRTAFAVLLFAAALGGCTFKDEVIGSPEMPASFGKTDKPWLGCPDLGGLYTWPPTEGHAFGYLSNGRKDKFGSFLELPLHPEAQIWVQGPGRKAAHEVALRSRMINRDPRLRIRSLTEEWGYRLVSDYKCSSGVVIFPEQELTQPGAPEWYGGKNVAAGARLSLLADGSLAVGQWVRVSGRTGSVGWGGQSWFTYPMPDRVKWYWTRLARIGPTGANVPPDDAALRPGGASVR